MANMRILQKAVNRKETQTDISQKKKDFESAKSALEDTVIRVKAKLMAQPTAPQQPVSSQPKTTTSTLGATSSAMRPQSSSGVGRKYGRGVQQPTRSSEDEQTITLLQRQLRSAQLEKDKLKELIEELKQNNQLFVSERDFFEDKLKSKSQQLNKWASQRQTNAHKVYMLESLLAEYKYTMQDALGNEQMRQLTQIRKA